MRNPALLRMLTIAAAAACGGASEIPAAVGAAGTPASGASISRAAALYHQGRFDSALTRLESLQGQGSWKRRDSLSLFQYQGMSSARLGREEQAVAYFLDLLGLDSLFQFPRNEDAQVLQAFARAREERTERLAGAASPPPSAGIARLEPVQKPAADPGMTASAPSRPEKISMVDSGGPSGKTSSAGSPDDGTEIGLARGAWPLGAGWLAGRKVKQGLALGLVQAGGIALSLYASSMQSREQNDPFQVRNQDELVTVQTWQWVQRVSLSTALGAYLFSLIAATGD